MDDARCLRTGIYDRWPRVCFDSPYRELVASHLVEREPYLRCTQPVYYAGIYHSLKTREVAELLAERRPTGATSLYDEWGERRSNFLLADLFAVDYVSHSPFSFAFLQAVGKDELIGLSVTPLPHYRHLLNVRVNRDAKIAAAQVEPLIEIGGKVYYHNNKPVPYRQTGIPTLVLSQYEQGRVVYCSGEPELNYADMGDPHYRQLIQGAVL